MDERDMRLLIAGAKLEERERCLGIVQAAAASAHEKGELVVAGVLEAVERAVANPNTRAR